MDIKSITEPVASAVDLIMPDLCALCGRTLILNRPEADRRIPLCRTCMSAAEDAVFSQGFPEIKRCRACGYPLTSEDGLCCRCREKQWNFYSSESIFLYLGTGKNLVKSYKFDNRKALAFYFAALIHRAYINRFKLFSVVPVPFRPSSRRRRGWDQIEVICKIIENEYSIPVVNCLKRCNGTAQKTMNYSSRLKNLENRIKLKKNTVLPTRILLLDDVFTTGATMDCCAGVLKAAGASDISCIAIALDL